MNMDRRYDNLEIIDYVDSVASVILRDSSIAKNRNLFFPLLIDALELSKGVEVGVNVGEFSKNLLDNSDIGKLFCVDNWMNNYGSNGYCDASGDNRFNECYNRLEKYITSGRAELVRADSITASKSVNDSDIDFLYIDGDHTIEGVVLDLHYWLPKVVTGGIVCGDDFKDRNNSGIKDYWGNQMQYGVEKVVRHYCDRYGYKLNITGDRVPNFWFVKTH